MNILDQYPCYDHTVLDEFLFQNVKPISVTLPYDKVFSGSKLIKKKVDKSKGDLIVFSFNLNNIPNVNDGDVLDTVCLGDNKTVAVLSCFNQVYKGHRVWSVVCQLQ
ncbi:hypothetical protein GQM33_15635 [Escherichia coli]|uniref:hypothetical protein n=1 Tax=Escherichia coli TaxID=562 RepID=UPI001302C7D3|nr:hypothetical protein [Escherichia coli]KAE9653672.1 hypothetical protein GP725_15635 [Escherichia coli]MWK71080.1 hypothetical protein [Escherichia coli]